MILLVFITDVAIIKVKKLSTVLALRLLFLASILLLDIFLFHATNLVPRLPCNLQWF